jgi:hypothetical protein
MVSCSDSNDTSNLELSIQDKIQLLEIGEWHPEGFETNVMYTFSNGERFTFYGSNGEYTEPAIPGTQAYTITGDLLTLDFNFGNMATYDIIFSCDNNIVKFFEDGELKHTLYKRGSNYEECL